MKIEKKLEEKDTFAKLSVGDVFIWDDDVYMVIEKAYGLGDECPYDGYAVFLEAGCIYGFDGDEECIKVSAKLIVTN